MTVQVHQMEEYTLCWFTNGDFFQFSIGLSPQEVSTSPSINTTCRALHRQWFDSSPMIPSPMEIGECLYCDVSPLPILLVQSCFVKFTCYIQSHNQTIIQSYNYTVAQVIYSYIHVFIHSYIRAYTTYTQASFVHGFTSQCLNVMSPRALFSHISSVLSSSIFQVAGSTNEQLTILFISQKWHPRYVGSWGVTHHFRWQVLHMNSLQIHVQFSLKVSYPVCLVTRCHLHFYLHTTINPDSR